MKNCEYCKNKNFRFEVNIFEYNFTIPKQLFVVCGKHPIKTEINFCPFCGRKITDENVKQYITK